MQLNKEGLTKSTSPLLKKIAEKISESRIGNKNWNWKGGYSIRDYGKEFTPELKLFIKTRDNFKCSDCGTNEMILQVHHNDENKKNNSKDNLITLCARCHRLRHTRKEAMLCPE